MASSYDVVLDVRAPHNRNPFYYPAQKTLRGEIRIAEVANKNVPGILANIGGLIPGHQVHLDMKGRKVKIVDRIGLPENADLLRRMRTILKAVEGPVSDLGDPDPDEQFQSAVEEWPTWLYHTRLMLDRGRLHDIRGADKIPPLDEIRRLGVIRLGDQGNVPPKDPKRPWNFLYPEDVPDMAGVA